MNQEEKEYCQKHLESITFLEERIKEDRLEPHILYPDMFGELCSAKRKVPTLKSLSKKKDDLVSKKKMHKQRSANARRLEMDILIVETQREFKERSFKRNIKNLNLLIRVARDKATNITSFSGL